MSQKRPHFCRIEERGCFLLESGERVSYDAKLNEYRIRFSEDAGSPIEQILIYCLWCGAKLPLSRREEWFHRIEGLNIDPWGEAIPEEYQTDAWWKNKS